MLAQKQEKISRLGVSMEDICPFPDPWIRMHERLSEAAADAVQEIPNPPRPLILSGWSSTNDAEKRRRWRETVAWAEKWGFADIVKGFAPDEFYRVEHPTTYQIGPYGGPMYLPWNSEARPSVSDEHAQSALTALLGGWEGIAGAELCRMTRPLRLTGKKRRRLLVYADPSARAPWGTWKTLGNLEAERRAFRLLREAVNAAIHPLAVDHIDFVHDDR